MSLTLWGQSRALRKVSSSRQLFSIRVNFFCKRVAIHSPTFPRHYLLTDDASENLIGRLCSSSAEGAAVLTAREHGIQIARTAKAFVVPGIGLCDGISEFAGRIVARRVTPARHHQSVGSTEKR
jgi:hypothetical protein